MSYNKEKWRVSQVRFGKVKIKAESGATITVMPENEGQYELNLENAIRMVAEHNACLDITTAALEDGIVRESVGSIAEEGKWKPNVSYDWKTEILIVNGIKVWEDEV